MIWSRKILIVKSTFAAFTSSATIEQLDGEYRYLTIDGINLSSSALAAPVPPIKLMQ